MTVHWVETHRQRVWQIAKKKLTKNETKFKVPPPPKKRQDMKNNQGRWRNIWCRVPRRMRKPVQRSTLYIRRCAQCGLDLGYRHIRLDLSASLDMEKTFIACAAAFLNFPQTCVRVSKLITQENVGAPQFNLPTQRSAIPPGILWFDPGLTCIYSLRGAVNVQSNG